MMIKHCLMLFIGISNLLVESGSISEEGDRVSLKHLVVTFEIKPNKNPGCLSGHCYGLQNCYGLYLLSISKVKRLSVQNGRCC